MKRIRFKDRADVAKSITAPGSSPRTRRAARRLFAKARAGAERAVRKSNAAGRIPGGGVRQDKGLRNLEYLQKKKQV